MSDSTRSPPDKGTGPLGIFAILTVVAFGLGVIGLLKQWGDALDPCINEASVPCPENRGIFVVAFAIGIPSAVGLAWTLVRHNRRKIKER